VLRHERRGAVEDFLSGGFAKVLAVAHAMVVVSR
jgi:hypothetical protein